MIEEEREREYINVSQECDEKKRRREGHERRGSIGRLHKDRSWRVPGASLHTMHLC